MDLELNGKRVLLTGGSKGIGYACARVFAAEGCRLHLAARDGGELSRKKTMLEAESGAAVRIHPVDLRQGEQARALAADCPDIDVLVNNAGAIPRGDLWQVDEPRWREAWDLKVFGYINLCRAVYPGMQQRGGGVIINIIGAAGQKPHLGYIAGGMGNASLMALTRALGAESLKDGIRVVGVNPGLIRTDRLEALLRAGAEKRFADPERWQELMPTEPPPGEPENIADLVAFLASGRACYITGTVVTADGGITAV